MSNRQHDFATVDMRDLKAALVERARSERVSVSVVVRRAVAREMDAADLDERSPVVPEVSRSTKVSIRLTAAEARLLRARAQSDGVSMGALLAALAAEIQEPGPIPNRAVLLAALVASSAELSTLNCNVHHLVMLLRQGSGQAAREYRDMLDGLTGDV